MNRKLLDKMLGTLGRKEFSVFEITNKYKKLEIYEIQDIKEVVDYLIELNYLNDERYCENYIRSGISKKWGLNKIKQNLTFDKRLNKELIETKIDSMQIDETESIKRIINTKYRNKDLSDYKEKSKAYTYLMSKGFKSSDIAKSLKVDLENPDD
jgi:regulatory protein